MLREKKAQSSLEMLIVTAAIFILSFIVLSVYFSLENTNKGLLVLKTAVNEKQAFTDVPFYVQEIEYVECPETDPASYRMNFHVVIPQNDELPLNFFNSYKDQIKEKLAKILPYETGELELTFSSSPSQPTC